MWQFTTTGKIYTTAYSGFLMLYCPNDTHKLGRLVIERRRWGWGGVLKKKLYIPLTLYFKTWGLHPPVC